jgi:hypothetical protein
VSIDPLITRLSMRSSSTGKPGRSVSELSSFYHDGARVVK